MALSDIAYHEIAGLSVLGILGILTFLMLSFTFAGGYLNHRGIRTIPFKYHKPAAITSLILASLHAILAIGSTLGF